MILFSLQSYQHARDGASREAVAVAELHVIADVLGGESGGTLHGQLNCCARSVISDEWPAMRSGDSSAVTQSWVDSMGIAGVAIIAYMSAQADRREPALIQALPIGLVTALVAAGLVVVFFLDHPYAHWSGSIKPVEMERTLVTIEDGHPAPCDERPSTIHRGVGTGGVASASRARRPSRRCACSSNHCA